MSKSIWDNLLTQLSAVHATHPDLRAFCPYPTDTAAQPVTPFHIPARHLFEAEPLDLETEYSALSNAFLAASPFATWRETYKGTDIGQDFLDRFGCYCLIGEGGAFQSDEMLAFVVYMPPHLHYPWHDHPAEELYLVLSGQGEFHRDGEPSEHLSAGQTSFHASGQPHALTTHDQSVLALVLWRNDFETKPKLTH